VHQHHTPVEARIWSQFQLSAFRMPHQAEVRHCSVASVVANLPWDLHELADWSLVDCFVLLELHWQNCFVVAADLSSWELGLYLHHMGLEIGYVLAVVDLDPERSDLEIADEELD
jgi:hypothetical protein